jgi:hypothetical protein
MYLKQLQNIVIKMKDDRPLTTKAAPLYECAVWLLQGRVVSNDWRAMACMLATAMTAVLANINGTSPSQAQTPQIYAVTYTRRGNLRSTSHQTDQLTESSRPVTCAAPRPRIP